MFQKTVTEAVTSTEVHNCVLLHPNVLTQELK